MVIYNASSTSSITVFYPCVNSGCTGGSGTYNAQWGIGKGSGAMFMWTTSVGNGSNGGWFPIN